MIHLGGVGHNRAPSSSEARILNRPERTLCGLPIDADVAERGQTLFPYDHPAACRVCLSKRAGCIYDHVVGVMFPDAKVSREVARA